MLQALHSAASDLRSLAAAISGVPTHLEGGSIPDQGAPPSAAPSVHLAAPATSLGLQQQYAAPGPVQVRRGVGLASGTPRPRREAPLTPLQHRQALVSRMLSPGSTSTGAGRGFAHLQSAQVQSKSVQPVRATAVADLAMGKRRYY